MLPVVLPGWFRRDAEAWRYIAPAPPARGHVTCNLGKAPDPQLACLSLAGQGSPCWAPINTVPVARTRCAASPHGIRSRRWRDQSAVTGRRLQTSLTPGRAGVPEPGRLCLLVMPSVRLTEIQGQAQTQVTRGPTHRAELSERLLSRQQASKGAGKRPQPGALGGRLPMKLQLPPPRSAMAQHWDQGSSPGSGAGAQNSAYGLALGTQGRACGGNP